MRKKSFAVSVFMSSHEVKDRNMMRNIGQHAAFDRPFANLVSKLLFANPYFPDVCFSKTKLLGYDVAKSLLLNKMYIIMNVC